MHKLQLTLSNNKAQSVHDAYRHSQILVVPDKLHEECAQAIGLMMALCILANELGKK